MWGQGTGWQGLGPESRRVLGLGKARLGRAWAHLPLAEAKRVPGERGDVAFLQQILAPQLPAAHHVVAEHERAMGANPGQFILEWKP